MESSRPDHIAHSPETRPPQNCNVPRDNHMMINYLVDLELHELEVMDSDRGSESLELTSDISPDLDSDDSMCWSDECIDLTAESDLETTAASDLDIAAQSTNGADSGQLPCESQPDWAFESEEWKQALYSSTVSCFWCSLC